MQILVRSRALEENRADLASGRIDVSFDNVVGSDLLGRYGPDRRLSVADRLVAGKRAPSPHHGNDKQVIDVAIGIDIERRCIVVGIRIVELRQCFGNHLLVVIDVVGRLVIEGKAAHRSVGLVGLREKALHIVLAVGHQANIAPERPLNRRSGNGIERRAELFPIRSESPVGVRGVKPGMGEIGIPPCVVFEFHEQNQARAHCRIRANRRHRIRC